MRDEVITEIYTERLRQIEKGYGEGSDDNKTFENWCDDIEAYIVWARQMARMGAMDKYRRRVRQVATLAVAACESFDRLASNDE